MTSINGINLFMFNEPRRNEQTEVRSTAEEKFFTDLNKHLDEDGMTQEEFISWYSDYLSTNYPERSFADTDENFDIAFKFLDNADSADKNIGRDGKITQENLGYRMNNGKVEVREIAHKAFEYTDICNDTYSLQYSRDAAAYNAKVQAENDKQKDADTPKEYAAGETRIDTGIGSQPLTPPDIVDSNPSVEPLPEVKPHPASQNIKPEENTRVYSSSDIKKLIDARMSPTYFNQRISNLNQDTWGKMYDAILDISNYSASHSLQDKTHITELENKITKLENLINGLPEEDTTGARASMAELKDLINRYKNYMGWVK